MKKMFACAIAAFLYASLTASAVNNVTPGLYESRYDSQIVLGSVLPAPSNARRVLAPYAANAKGDTDVYNHTYYTASDSLPGSGWPPPPGLYPGFTGDAPVSFMYSGYIHVGEGSNNVWFATSWNTNFGNRSLRIGGHEILNNSTEHVALALATGWHKFEYIVDHDGAGGWDFRWNESAVDLRIGWQGNDNDAAFPVDAGDGSLFSATQPADYDADADYHKIIRPIGDYGANNDAEGISSFDSAGFWENNLAPMPGNYYYQVIFVNVMRTPANALTNTFEGKVLWIDGGRREEYQNSSIWYCGLDGGAVVVSNLWLHGNFMMAGPARKAELFGNISIPESVYPNQDNVYAPSRFYTNVPGADHDNNKDDRELYIHANISGSKPVVFNSSSRNSDWAGVKRNIHLRGDNSGYTGRFIACTEYGGTLTIVEERNLGAPSAKLTLQRGILRFDCEGDIAIASPGRVITLEDWDGGYPRMDVRSGQTATIACAVDGTGRFGKLGTGRLVFDTDTEYTGKTFIQSGSLLFNGAANSTAEIEVAAGASIGGTGTVHAAAAFAAGAGINLIGNGFGALAFAGPGGATLDGAMLSFDVRDPLAGASDSLVFAGPLTLNGACKINLSMADILPAGTYTLASAGAITVGGTLELATPNPDIDVVVDAVANEIKIVARNATMDFAWKGDAGANVWDFSAGNWFPTSVAFADGMDVVFNDLGVASAPVEITNNVAPGAVLVNAGKNYTFATGANTMSFGTLVKSAAGTGSLALRGNFSVGENIVVEQGSGPLEQEAGSVISGAGGLLVHSDAVLAGGNTYAGGTVLGIPDGFPTASLTLLSSGALGAGDFYLNPARNQDNATHKLTLGAGTFIEGKTMRTYYRASLMTRNEAGACGWHGDILLSDYMLLYARAQHPEATLAIGAPGGGNIISGLNEWWVGFTLICDAPGLVALNSRVAIQSDDTHIEVTNDAKLEINSASNRIARLRLPNGALRLNSDDAFATTPTLQMGVGWHVARATLDLNGHDLAISRFTEEHSNGDNGAPGQGWQRIVSAAPATLAIDCEPFYYDYQDNGWQRGAEGGSTFCRNNTMISGSITLVKDGAGMLAIGRHLEISGDVVVNDGKLVLAAEGDSIIVGYHDGNINTPNTFKSGEGSFGAGATNILVNGGTLVVRNDSAFSRDAELALKSGAKMHLSDDVNATVSFLHLGSKLKPAGIYGSSASFGAQIVDDEFFTGAGVLTVLHGTRPLVIIVR